MSDNVNLLRYIYNADLPYLDNYNNEIKTIFKKTIQFHPLNKVYDFDFIANLYYYDKYQLPIDLLLNKTKTYSIISYLNNIPIEYDEEYLTPTYFNINPSFIEISNTEFIYLGYFIHLFSMYCDFLNEKKSQIALSSIIERKNQYNIDLIKVNMPQDNNFYYIKDLNIISYQLDNLNDLSAFNYIYDIRLNEKYIPIYNGKPEKVNVFGGALFYDLEGKLDELEFMDKDKYIVNISYIAGKIRNAIKYTDIIYNQYNQKVKTQLLKSDFMHLIKLDSEYMIYPKKYYVIDNSINKLQYLFPILVYNPNENTNIILQNLSNNLVNITNYITNKQIRDYLYIVLNKNKIFPYTIYYDKNQYKNYIVYEYDLPPLIYFKSYYKLPILIMRYNDYSYIIIVSTLDDNDNITNIINTEDNNAEFTIINNFKNNRKIKIIHYKPYNFKQMHNIKFTINQNINNQTILNNVEFTFKAFEYQIPYGFEYNNMIHIPSIIDTENLLLFDYNNTYNIEQHILNNIKNLYIYTDANINILDNLMFTIKTTYSFFIANALNIFNIDNIYEKTKIVFVI